MKFSNIRLIPAPIKNQLKKGSILKSVRKAHTIKANWNAEEAIEYLFSKDCKLIVPWQNKEELMQLAKEVEKKKPKVVLEIGTAKGGTLFLWALLAADDATIISLDLPEGLYGGGYPDWKIPVYTSFARKNQTIHLIRDDSHSPRVFEKVESILNDKSIDFLFIDGDHTYEGVKNDFEMYRKLIGKKGLVAFHDIVPDRSPEPDHYVSQYWNDIKDNYPYQEFVKDRDQSKMGLGLLKIEN